MVLLASSYDQSKYFRAEEILEDKTLKIKSVTEEMVGQGTNQEKKLVVWFDNSKKGLVLNKTNNRTIRSAYEDDTTGWVGQLIVLYRTSAPFGGRQVPALRVRIPPKGNSKTTITTGKPKPPAAAEEPVADDLPDFDDNIGL